MAAPPVNIKLRRKSGVLSLTYANGNVCELSAEFLRVHSLSAEVRGHGKQDVPPESGKRDVQITEVEAVGNYAIRLHFDDGHNTGLYSWDYLQELCTEQETLWQDYLRRLHESGGSRDPLPPDTQVVKIKGL